MPVPTPSRVYTVSGGGGGAGESSTRSTSLPDLLRPHGSSNKRLSRKNASARARSIARAEELNKIELIQDFEFPEASNRIASTRDGNHIVATGTYKPSIRTWDNEQLSLKFQRVTEAENVDFELLSDDWTKMLLLQTDRTLELHARGGFHTRIRIPKFGRALAYHYNSAVAYVGAAGAEVYRLNLDQGRFLAPFELDQAGSAGRITGCNALDVNPAHGLMSLATEGDACVQLWDARSRNRVGSISIATRSTRQAALLSARNALPGISSVGDGDSVSSDKTITSLLSATCLRSAQDGLNLAVGTTTGHVQLYDYRMSNRAYKEKDQGFGLPINSLSWCGDAPRLLSGDAPSNSHHPRSEAKDCVLSADSKVIKIWSRSEQDDAAAQPSTSSTTNLASIPSSTASGDFNQVHHIPGTGMLVAAMEATRCAAWYVPTLGPAPAWCSFLDSLTDEMDGDVATLGKENKPGVYDDFKFVDKEELRLLNMEHMLGTDLLRPYMHGYFVHLRLYEKARLLANPTAYSDARERAIRENIEKASKSRIRPTLRDEERLRSAKKELEGIRVNRELALKIQRSEERASRAAATQAEGDRENAEDGADGEPQEPKVNAKASRRAEKMDAGKNLLRDDRFKEMFSDPAFEVDKNTREWRLLNPSGEAGVDINAQDSERQEREGRDRPYAKTAAELEDEDGWSERESLDPDDEGDRSDAGDSQQSDSEDEGALAGIDPRKRLGGKQGQTAQARGAGTRLIEDEDDSYGRGRAPSALGDRSKGSRSFSQQLKRGAASGQRDEEETLQAGSKEISFLPSSKRAEGDSSRGSSKNGKKGRAGKNGAGESFGAGLSRGAGKEQGVGVEGLEEDKRFGRKKRRVAGRSASRNVMLRR
ncbi:hypothetical protein IE81DRAFT_325972 [Ceraceosorus guamensis]|uniref:Uncharacterized protein n=1 Tax=Ceraceosorus guamensis TaxID=1522189 RepID=A0A316VSG6_9BASI|nr:hypothetical protein IE81DRAFT_325972 [Ceraceosorus guamensis]PWN39998.1 hypothetical protein IE81DRAFT_325972 [Ceraceosorus guamensis]